MLKRDILNWWFLPKFLKPLGKHAEVLFAGPWVGEFGWELINWQPFLRKLSHRYQKVIVCCRQGNEAMYEDFAHDFLFHDIKGIFECNKALSIESPEEVERIYSTIPPKADHLPSIGWQPSKRKEFIKFGKTTSALGTDIIFHPRGRRYGLDRNWKREKWNVLIERLNRHGLQIGCIGLKDETLDVVGNFFDFRDSPLKKVMDLIASTQLVIGPSSGPMHLSSLCGSPHLVWTDKERFARGKTNRFKYEKWWNPFDTPAFVLDEYGFDPPVDPVEKNIIDLLSRHDLELSA
jgi:ADP-heptose:LPS heptosyltransferase